MGVFKYSLAIALASLVLIGCKAKSGASSAEVSSVSVSGSVQEMVPGIEVDYRQFNLVLAIENLPEGTKVDSVVYNQSSAKLQRVNADGNSYKSRVRYITPATEGFVFKPKTCVVYMTNSTQKVVMHGFSNLVVKEKMYLP